MMTASLIGSLCNFTLNTFIRRYGGIYDVGYFQSANTITNQYIGVVFTAMGLDYFPRLSAVSSDNNKVKELANNQSELVILAITPMAIALILFAPLIVKILLTEKFLSIIPILRLFGLGVIFKAISYPLGYISFSKGDRTSFFYLEGIFSNIFTLSLNCLFFYIYGIVGLGISYAISYIIYCIIIVLFTKYKYNFKHNHKVGLIIIISILLVTFTLAASYLSDNIISIILMSIIFLISLIYSLLELNKRLSLFKKLM